MPNTDGPRPTMLVGAHLEQGWCKFVPMLKGILTAGEQYGYKYPNCFRISCVVDNNENFKVAL